MITIYKGGIYEIFCPDGSRRSIRVEKISPSAGVLEFVDSWSHQNSKVRKLEKAKFNKSENAIDCRCFVHPLQRKIIPSQYISHV